MSALDDYLNLEIEYRNALDRQAEDDIAARMDVIWNKKMTSADRVNYWLLCSQREDQK